MQILHLVMPVEEVWRLKADLEHRTIRGRPFGGLGSNETALRHDVTLTR